MLLFTAEVTISERPKNTYIQVNKTGFLHCVASYNPQLDVTYTWWHGDILVEFEKVFRLGENRYEVWHNPHYIRVSVLHFIHKMPLKTTPDSSHHEELHEEQIQ